MSRRLSRRYCWLLLLVLTVLDLLPVCVSGLRVSRVAFATSDAEMACMCAPAGGAATSCCCKPGAGRCGVGRMPCGPQPERALPIPAPQPALLPPRIAPPVAVPRPEQVASPAGTTPARLTLRVPTPPPRPLAWV